MSKDRVRGVLESGLVSVGDAAPDFELPALIGGVRKTFRLSEYRGKTVVLAFYPFNWRETSIQADGWLSGSTSASVGEQYGDGRDQTSNPS